MLIVTKILTAGLFAAVHLTGGSGDPLKIKPTQTMAGGDSKIEFPMVRMISAEKQWKELWMMHKGIPLVPSAAGDITNADVPKLPTVDFEKSQVLVVFGGHVANVQAYDYVKTFAKDNTAVIQLSQNFFPTSTVKTMMTPFVMLVIPKEPVPIEVELDSIAKDGSHYWMKIASYAVPKEKKASG
jgi:hypothetical protein